MNSNTNTNTKTKTDTDKSSSESYVETDSIDENLSHTNNLELTGKTLKKYNIICEIGRGAYSIVWLAYSIVTNKFYALKVQDPKDYADGLDEIKFVQKLPKTPAVFNNIIEYFVEEKNKNKYLCSVWELHYDSLDGIIRKGNFTTGLNITHVKKIMRQLIDAVKILHKKHKVFHGDIKTDNILIKGINSKNAFIIDQYSRADFVTTYTKAKQDFWLKTGQNLKSIDKMDKADKQKIREKIHGKITDTILEAYAMTSIDKYYTNEKYINDMNIVLGDFGTHCEEGIYYTTQFGTRYYLAPEIILMGKCKYPVDIWAIGCTFYELISGKFLFKCLKKICA